MPGQPKAGEPAAADRPPPTGPTACPAGAFPPYCGPQQSYNRQADFAARWAALPWALVANHVARPGWPFQPPPIPRIAERPTGVWVQPIAPSSHVGWPSAATAALPTVRPRWQPSPTAAIHSLLPCRLKLSSSLRSNPRMAWSAPHCRLCLRPRPVPPASDRSFHCSLRSRPQPHCKTQVTLPKFAAARSSSRIQKNRRPRSPHIISARSSESI